MTLILPPDNDRLDETEIWDGTPKRLVRQSDPDLFTVGGTFPFVDGCSCPDNACWGFFGEVPYDNIGAYTLVVSGISWPCNTCAHTNAPNGLRSFNNFTGTDPNGVFNIPAGTGFPYQIDYGSWNADLQTDSTCGGLDTNLDGVYRLRLDCVESGNLAFNGRVGVYLRIQGVLQVPPPSTTEIISDIFRNFNEIRFRICTKVGCKERYKTMDNVTVCNSAEDVDPVISGCQDPGLGNRCNGNAGGAGGTATVTSDSPILVGNCLPDDA